MIRRTSRPVMMAGWSRRKTTTTTTTTRDAAVVLVVCPSRPRCARPMPPGAWAYRAPATDDVRRRRGRRDALPFSSSSPSSLSSAAASIPARGKDDGSRRKSDDADDGPESSWDKRGDDEKKEKRKDDSNIFLDNLGKIFLSTIGIVLLGLLRSTKSNNSRTQLREDVEFAALLDPLEIDDLRLANEDFTVQVWEKIVGEMERAFLGRDRHVTYPEFLTVVTRVMREEKGEGFTIQFGHLIDRVVIAEMERIEGGGVNEDVDVDFESRGEEGVEKRQIQGRDRSRGELPLPFLLVALSLALHGTVLDRVRVLYESALIFDDGDGYDDGIGMIGGGVAGEGEEGFPPSSSTLSGRAASRIVRHLQRTCQLVPEAQIVEANSTVPYRTHRVGTGDELVERARGGHGGKKGTSGVTREREGPVTLEEFHAILRSRAVCAWGECYVKKTGGTATSDR